MMILGLGNDLCNIERIEASIARFGDRFIQRLFTDIEIAKSERRARGGETARAASYAKRFAAKEACAKALGTGLRSGVFWRDMEVVNLPSGQPTLRLTGGAAARLRGMTPAGHTAVIHLTMTDDPPMAQAFVVIEVRVGG
jgi:holo-[acyl-carrier protein] synthase